MYPVISVIVPVYNVENYILKCLKSIVNQSYRNFELIIVDDRGTDKSIQIAEQYLSTTKINYEIITRDQNGGLSAARNSGIEIAKGEYLSFIDSDDYVEPIFLEKMYEAVVSSSDIDIVVCGMRGVYQNPTIKSLSIYPPDRKEPIKQKEALTLLLQGKYLCYFCRQLFRRSLFEKLRFPIGLPYEDVLTLPRILLNVRKVIFIPDILYNYFQRPGSITKKFDSSVLRVWSEIEEIKTTVKDCEIFSPIEFDKYYNMYEHCLFHTIGSHISTYSMNYSVVKPILLDYRRKIKLQTVQYILTDNKIIGAGLLILKISPKIYYNVCKKFIGRKARS